MAEVCHGTQIPVIIFLKPTSGYATDGVLYVATTKTVYARPHIFLGYVRMTNGVLADKERAEWTLGTC